MPGSARSITIVRPAEDSSPTALLTAMAGLPLGHPQRPALREQAIEAWLPLAHRIVGRYRRHGMPVDDLLQVAAVGLIKAVDRFDPARRVEFAAFAIPTVVGELKRYFRDRTWAVRVPRRLQELHLAISTADAELTQRLGRSPTVTDLADFLGIGEEEVLEGLEGSRARTTISLSTPAGRDDSHDLTYGLGTNDHGFDLVEARDALGRAMVTLTPRNRRILFLYFYGNQSQTEIAAQIGISQMHVSRLLTKSLRRLRQEMNLESG